MKKQVFLQLVDRYLKGEASLSEKVLVEEYIKQLEGDNLFQLSAQESELLKDSMRDKIYMRLNDEITAQQKTTIVRRLPILRYAAAAVVFMAVASGLFFYTNKSISGQNTAKNIAHVISPGSNKAILTLADGSKIELNDSLSGSLAQQGNINIKKTADGQLIYQVGNNNGAIETGDNMISTPRGGQYQVILPDQSHVWLNASSSIKFPAAFAGNLRQVKITGEVYFEVTRNTTKPFRVETKNGTAIEVLGTHFNVNAYEDEPLITATLLSGSVNVKSGSRNEIIKPGEQARINANRETKIGVYDVNAENVAAWKDDLFVFENEDIQTAMRRIARWYNIEISYPQGIPEKTIGGTISRFKDVAELLNLIEQTGGVKFKIEGRRVLVMS
ncbi:DUF4974 domain-containing protein [Pedobacter sp. MC2016-14]|uniref:FecR family protein n=1 Tax=Pedobacter sp. MC2016-14 TaxID=2897327 RepID=UPI001E2E9B7A|nr:FecR domain-containing protein [Pedobacter sp. MC2016-14]MCD0490393.1 DUF4974 domain-containing protein [Pedobacter sp. MC2016-14]